MENTYFPDPWGVGGGTQVCKWPKCIYIFETTVDRFCSVCVPTFGLHARQCYTFPVGFPLFSAIFVRSYTFSYVCYSLVFGSTAHFASRAMLPFLTIGSLVGSVPLIRESQNKRWLSFHPFSGLLFIDVPVLGRSFLRPSPVHGPRTI